MYERNAIVLERYFNQMFGYHMKNNIKTNFKDYCELVECLEKYKNISEEEENIMQEYDTIANKIREIQKTQETLNKKNTKYQEERANIFQNIDENSNTIQKKLENVNNNIENINEEMKQNAQQFVNIITEFNEKSLIRTTCGKNRRNIESEYNKKLNETLDNYQDIDVNFEKKARQFIETETEDIEKELKEKIMKNGEKEKIPFNTDVVTKAIILSIDIQKRETDILANIYDKTNKLFTEIKNNTTQSDKHKKIIIDSKSKLELIGAIKEYLVQFLDNERLTAVNGEEEHNNLMKEACKNFEEDLVQINNLYTLLLKEITKKITKKSYPELYHFDYLKNLENKAAEFDAQIKKLNLPVTIINPNYWRIEGMKKIYDVFFQNVTENYGRDLSMFMPSEEEVVEEEEEKEENLDLEPKKENLEDKKTKQTKNKTKSTSKKEDAKAEIDKKIDMILGFKEEDDDWMEEDSQEDDDWQDDDDYDDEEDWDDEEDFEEDWEDEEELEDEEDDWRNERYFEEVEDDDFEEEEEDFDEDEEEDDWEDYSEIEEDEDDEYEESKVPNKIKSSKSKQQEDSWENEFIRMDNKENTKKKKGFFDKFKK